MSRARSILEQLEMRSGVRVSVNPTSINRLKADVNLSQLIKDQFAVHVDELDVKLRFLLHLPTGDLFFWDTETEIHAFMAKSLGVDYNECIRGDATYTYPVESPNDGKWDYGLEDLDWRMKKDIQDKYKQAYENGWQRIRSLFP